MQQVAEWLEKLGMSEYAQRFVENRIDFSVLPDLTDHDLEKLGVVLGDRRKMLRAIANLEAHTTIVAAAAPAGPPRDTAERRQVTVMFSDLVGSTALSARMDPEDLREVITTYQKCVAEAVRRFGGFVAKYMGDGVLVYFGYPEAHEDDADRAVRAALELIAAVTALRLRTRVGIATGLVVVGDLVGSGEALDHGIVGDTPNLAARLQVVAEPNSVVVAESTRKLVGSLFELEEAQSRQICRSFNPPVRVRDQSKDSKISRHDNFADAPRASRRGDRINTRLPLFALFGHGALVAECPLLMNRPSSDAARGPSWTQLRHWPRPTIMLSMSVSSLSKHSV
jgi:class 3 adenylate cyclase